MRLAFIPLLLGALPSFAIIAPRSSKQLPIQVPKGPGITAVKDSYIVMFHDKHTLADHNTNIKIDVSKAASSFSFFKNLNGYRAVFKKPSVIEAVRLDPGVKIVQQNTLHKYDPKIKIKPAKSPLGNKDRSLFKKRWEWIARPLVENWKLASGATNEQEMRTLKDAGYDVNVYVIDSGVNPNDQVDDDRLWWLGVQNQRDRSPYCWNGEDSIDNMGHGTGCAAIIGGKDIGVAPNVNIISVKNYCSGTWSMDLSLQAIEDIWARETDLAEREAVPTGTIINFSQCLGSTCQTSPALQQGLSKIKNEGVLIVAAAGNDNRDIGLDMVPQSLQDILVVGNQAKSGSKHPSSNYGAALDIWAPGEEVDSKDHLGNWVTFTGTSFAAPWVVGAAALIWSYESSVIGRDVNKILERIGQNAIKNGVQGVPQGTTALMFQTGANSPDRDQSHPYAYVGTRGASNGGTPDMMDIDEEIS